MTCKVDGCQKSVAYRGYCRSHYERLLRHGDPLAGRTAVGAPQAWLQEMLSVDQPEDSCVIWPFARDNHGYPTVRIDGEMLKAHRYVCQSVNGPAPATGMEAAHSCGNGDEGCINPKHLRWATPKENTADAVAHGTNVRGEKHGMSKLTEEAAREIIAQRGIKSTAELAREFGVSPRTVRHVQAGDTWQSARGDGSSAGKRKLTLRSLSMKREAQRGVDHD